MSGAQPPAKLCIGLTGGIGSGKSTVAALFKELGAAIIDSDVISHQLTLPGGCAITAISAEFGAEYIDASGAMDRPRMRQRVFSDPAAKRRLERILHPLIRTQMLAETTIHSTGTAPYLMLVVPLLFEADAYRELVQRVLVVDCAESTQVERCLQRGGLLEAEVNAIMAQQLPRAERLRRADDILHNDSDLDSLRTQVQTLHQDYLTSGQSSN